MIESLKYADEQIEHFKQIEGMDKDTLRIIRLELIAAFRAGYELAVKKQSDLKK